MKLVFASDSFKGSLSSVSIGNILEDEAKKRFPEAICVKLPIADGGEGTLEAISSMRDGERVSLAVHDGLMRSTTCEMFLCGDDAFVEAASSCGLTMLAEEERNPLLTSSYGVGECVCHALDRGCKHVTVGLGGSCTNDGGTGFLRALGVRFFDAGGRELAGRGLDLERIATIDVEGMHKGVTSAAFTVMSDVSNPLLGPNGATCVFARQKGADDAMVERLEAGMVKYAKAVEMVFPGTDFSTYGFGAAGGLGMALSVFMGASIRPGIEELLRCQGFDDIIADADLVVTGEGSLDSQSLQGKAISGVASHAHRQGVRVAAICGKVNLPSDALNAIGFDVVIEAGAGQTLRQAMSHARENYIYAARKLFSIDFGFGALGIPEGE